METEIEDRLCIQYLDNDGNVLSTHFGPSKGQQEEFHQSGSCDSTCPFCYQEACNEFIKNQLNGN